MARVVLENLVKVYPDKSGANVRAVNGINLTIEDREFMVLVGPSGCGKSTTLRMIAGLEEISGGTISIDDKVVNQTAPKDRDIAMVFQNYALYPHMSVYDNLAFGLKLRKIPKAEIDARVREAAAMLGIETFLDRKPKALSGGQRQRVAVGRAIVRKPKVFLFDEPLSNLDAKMRASTRTEISRLHARLGATMIYVTHDQVEAMTMGDRICVMKDGNIMQVAEPLELYNRPANLFVAGFIGSPQMNFLHGSIQNEGGRLHFVEKSEDTPIKLTLGEKLATRARDHVGRPVIFGIRPEDVHDVAGTSVASGQPSATLRVEVAEPMGAETYLYLHSGTHALVARVRPTASYTVNEPLQVAFDLEHAHLFDAVSEKAL